jgi:hypothetical protein
MAATIYTGNGTSGTAIANTVNGISFQPDWGWVKARSQAYDALIFDSVRGATKSLTPSSTSAEITNSANGYVSAFNANGFTLTAGSGTIVSVNESGTTYVGWNWKESASAGFDIVACTTNGSGILTATSHNLGVVPAMVILKSRTGTDAWYVYHQNSTGTPTQGTLQLNTTSAVNTTNGSSGGVDKWTLTSTTFAAGNAAWTYQASTNHIAYLFSAVAGYSAFGSYTGNGSADGTFVYTGFRPRFILIKESTPNARGWRIFDTSRNTYNQAGLTLSPNSSDAEDSGSGLYNQMDILSNGFKLRAGTNSEPTNESGATYIYACFAENPFKLSLAR